jgi:hypothetical protein
VPDCLTYGVSVYPGTCAHSSVLAREIGGLAYDAGTESLLTGRRCLHGKTVGYVAMNRKHAVIVISWCWYCIHGYGVAHVV